jgi:hypothetical protein
MTDRAQRHIMNSTSGIMTMAEHFEITQQNPGHRLDLIGGPDHLHTMIMEGLIGQDPDLGAAIGSQREDIMRAIANLSPEQLNLLDGSDLPITSVNR